MDDINVNITVNKPPAIAPVVRTVIPNKTSEYRATVERASAAKSNVVRNKLPQFYGGYYR